MATGDEFVDGIRRQHHQVEGLARLHTPGRVHTADRFEDHRRAGLLFKGGRDSSASTWRVAMEEMPIGGRFAVPRILVVAPDAKPIRPTHYQLLRYWHNKPPASQAFTNRPQSAHGSQATGILRPCGRTGQLYPRLQLRWTSPSRALSRQSPPAGGGAASEPAARNGRGAVPTEAGKLLLEHGRGILHQVTLTREELGSSRGALAGRVSHRPAPQPVEADHRAAHPAPHRTRRCPTRRPSPSAKGLSAPHCRTALIAGRLDVAVLYAPRLRGGKAPSLSLLRRGPRHSPGKCYFAKITSKNGLSPRQYGNSLLYYK